MVWATLLLTFVLSLEWAYLSHPSQDMYADDDEVQETIIRLFRLFVTLETFILKTRVAD